MAVHTPTSCAREGNCACSTSALVPPSPPPRGPTILLDCSGLGYVSILTCASPLLPPMLNHTCQHTPATPHSPFAVISAVLVPHPTPPVPALTILLL